MVKRKITDIFQDKIITRRERNLHGEWDTVEKTYHEVRPVDSLSSPLRLVHCFVDIFAISLIQIPIGLIGVFETSMVSDFLPLIVYFGYYVVMEFYFQRTVGKYLTGSLVVNEYGERPDFKTICVRTLTRIIPIDPFSVLWTNDERPWHDKWTKTYVVSKDELSLINRIQLGERPKKSDEGKWDQWHNWQQRYKA